MTSGGARQPPALPRPSPAIALAGLIAFGAVLRLVGLGSASLWLDEASSWGFASRSLTEIWSSSPPLDNANPPLYYTLLHIWLTIGDSPFDLRLLSVVASLAAIPVTYALGKVIGGHRLGLLGAALATVSPFAIQYAQEARAYSFLLLAATLVMWALAMLLTQPEGPSRRLVWLVYVVAAGGALLLHDTGLLLVFSANIVVLAWLALRRPRPARFVRDWALAQVGVILIWLPWLPGFIAQTHQVQADFWIPFPTVERIASQAYELLADQTFVTAPTGARWLVAGAIAAGLVGLAILGLVAVRRAPGWVAFLVVFMTVAPLAEVGLSVIRPLLLARTLIWTTVPAEIAMAAGILALRSLRIRAIALGFALLVSSWGIWDYMTIPQKEAWDQAAAYVAAHAQDGDGVLFATAATRVPFDYYFRTSARILPEHGLPREMPADHYVEEPMTQADEAALAALASVYPRLWLVSSGHADFSDPAGLIPHTLANTDDLVAMVPFIGDVELFLYVRRATAGPLPLGP